MRMTEVRANHGRSALMPASAAEVRAAVTLPPRSVPATNASAGITEKTLSATLCALLG